MPNQSVEKNLIVEDDPTLQRVLRDNFEVTGYKVQAASDGRNGLGSLLRLSS